MVSIWVLSSTPYKRDWLVNHSVVRFEKLKGLGVFFGLKVCVAIFFFDDLSTFMAMWVCFPKLSYCVYVFGFPLHYNGLTLGLFVLSDQSCKMGIFNMHLQIGIVAFGLYSGFVVLDDFIVVNLGL